MDKVRTRIAPSPTGLAHVGTGYTTLFNYAFAKKNNGVLILRLEDTDTKREVVGAEEAIYLNLKWLGFEWQEGADVGGPFAPYKQSERLDLYQKKAEQLVKEGKAYKEEGAIRFKNPEDDVSWHDLIHGDITFPGKEVQDFVILKSNGFPTYHFAVVVDDIEMEITHIIRGEDHISNTPKHLALFKALGHKAPEFAHFPTLRGDDKRKLSKRRDTVDLGSFRNEGYLPQALVNFMCLLGWSHPEGKEIFSLEEFVEKFSLERVREAGPVFDTQKLDWLNQQYINATSSEELAHLINQHTSFKVTPQMATLIKTRISKLSEAEELLIFFEKDPEVARDVFEDENAIRHASSALKVLGEIPDWTLENINNTLAQEVQEKGFKTGEFYMTLRLVLTGKKVTPPINESMVLLGQDEVLQRLERAQQILLETPPKDLDLDIDTDS